MNERVNEGINEGATNIYTYIHIYISIYLKGNKTVLKTAGVLPHAWINIERP